MGTMSDKELVKHCMCGCMYLEAECPNCNKVTDADRIEALTAKVEMFRETNRRMNRRVQLLEGWWQRRLEREKNQRGAIMWMWWRDRANQPLNVKALEEAAYQRGYEDGRDDRFNIPPRRAKPRREGGTP
jgi:hypothetical protein